MKLDEIAEKIYAHLQNMELNHNTETSHGMKRYYHVNAVSTGKKVEVSYVSYQLASSLSKEEATGYLAWLDAGNIGKHYDYQRDLLR